jgi:hypothetical protein
MGKWKHQHLVILDGDKTACLVQDSDYAEKIVACVNACEGMEDPAKEIEDRIRHAYMEGYNAGREDATESCNAIMEANLTIVAQKILNCDFDDAIEYIEMLSEGGQQ